MSLKIGGKCSSTMITSLSQKIIQNSKHSSLSKASIHNYLLSAPTIPKQHIFSKSFHNSCHIAKGKKPIPRPSGPKHIEKKPKKTDLPSEEEPASRTLEVRDIDPQQLASEFVQFSAARKPGTESLQELTQTQKLQNYGLAVGLLAFVASVWYYSMTSVGRSEGGLEQLISEAEGAKSKKERQSVAEKEVDELLKAEMSLGSLDSTDEAMGGKGLVVAVAAPDEIATREEERNLEVAQNNGANRRPLWKRVVLFWRKE